MPNLKDILYKVSIESVSGSTDIKINDILFDSRNVKKGSLFIAVKGTQVDGHSFINEAIEKGAVAIVMENGTIRYPSSNIKHSVFIQVKDSREALAVIASNFYDNPSEKIKLVGVTGTNGKTTTVTLLHQLFRKLGYNTGLISTIQNKINEDIVTAPNTEYPVPSTQSECSGDPPEYSGGHPLTLTTPDPVSINQLLAKMNKAGCTHCFMEVSSHGIEQKRIAGLHFSAAIFTNITHEHLDYHSSFDEYISTKKHFFDTLSSSAFALVNHDDKRWHVMLQNTKAAKYSYALRSVADFKAKLVSNTLEGLELEIDGKQVWFKLIGTFNAYNLLAAYSTAVLLDEVTQPRYASLQGRHSGSEKENKEKILTILSDLTSVNGRFEVVSVASPQAPGLTAIVDYAHTPDALKNVLSTINELKNGNAQLITVVGCGGNRDTSKRPMMAGIACRFSDKVIFTSDNPRNEAPEKIIEDMQKGVKTADHKKTLTIIERKEAIKTACSMANPDDIIIIAGKGHETYQEIKGIRKPFDDKKVLIETLKLLQ
ncbi:MAG: UDP-N-acetylmuramoyl-L-alanyl-D-glutamate--2,6-diaminopimelate ligase [Cytophagales bacterium]|nr:UDP-N-acetylmuramoyl-L-alanyl-D-glutamate--2,6-diaminopimelate ligase [Cytophagales bacterium]